MKKVTTLTLAGLMAVTAGANASDARWNGFGSANAYIADVQDIWTLPGVIASHADTTYIELGAAQSGTNTAAATGANTLSVVENAWGGVHAAMGPGVLGLWFNRVAPGQNNIASGYTIPNSGPTISGANYTSLGALTITPLRNQLDIIYGFNLSDATTLGLGISRGVAGSKTDTTVTGSPTTSNDVSSNDFGLNLGLEQKEVGPISLLEVGLQFNSRGYNATQAGATTNKVTGAGSGINLRVGGDMVGEKGAFSRFEVGFSTQSLNWKAEPATALPSTAFTESKNSAMGWNLGYAVGGSNDAGMGLMGLMLRGLNQSRDEANNGSAVNKADRSTLNLLASTAGEAKVNNWLSFRAGLESDLFFSQTTTTETGSTATTTKTVTSTGAHAGTAADPNAKASMGTTVTLGSMIVDGVLNQGFLFGGPYLLSGIPQGFSTQVSVTWPWGGSK